jgi:hypothetical protein
MHLVTLRDTAQRNRDAMILLADRLTVMKRSTCWSLVFDLLIAAGCVALVSKWDQARARRRRREAKLDSSLADTFPASDPISY